MKERLRWLGHVLQVKDHKSSKLFLVGQPSKANRKAGHPQMGWEYVVWEDLVEMGTSGEGLKRVALSRLGLRRSMRSYVYLRWFGGAVSF